MSKLKILSEANTIQGKNQQKGKLFEDLMSKVLRHYGYQIDSIPSVNYAGMEIDIEGKDIAMGIPLYAECKFYENEIDSPKIQAFFGKYMTKWWKYKKAHGIFIAIPGLNSHAKGFYNENIKTNSEITLNLFEEDEVLKAIFDLGLIVRVDVIAQKIPKEIGKAGDWNIIYSDRGYFFLQYVTKTGDVTPRYIVLFDEKGNGIVNADDLKYVIENMPELKDFEILKLSTNTPINTSYDVMQDMEQIVEVVGSSSYFEYQFPAAPQFYVGRKDIIKEFIKFTEEVIKSEVTSRGVLFEANSGWGKSSTVLKCVEELGKKGHISFAIDSRSASSARFILNVTKYIIEKDCIVDLMKSKDNTISGYEGVFKIFEKVSEKLKLQNKLLVVFFDQFENIFYNKEVLKNICDLFLKICDKKLNIVFGFSWKTDLISLTSDFPYALRDSISSQSKCISLKEFSENEIKCLLDELSKEIKASLRRDLSFFLSEYSQGYPWLLKKLCAHVKAQREKGISQTDIATNLLNVKDLFKADMAGLSAKQENALHNIARSAPISINEIGEFNSEILTPLINRRLVVRIGQKYDIYWDIFRDYLNSGKLPEQENYIIRSPIQSVYKVTKALVKMGPSKIENFNQHTGLSKRTLFNVAKDMELLGISKVKSGVLSLKIDLKDDKEFDKLLRTYLNNYLKRNRLINIILQKLEEKNRLSLEGVAKILEKSCPYISASEKTWLSYARNFMGWMDSADIVLLEKDDIVKYETGTQIREKHNFKIKMRSGTSIIQYSPMEEILCRMIKAAKSGGRINWDGLARSTISKSLSVLETIGFILRENKSQTINLFQDAFIFVENVAERSRLFAEKAQAIPMFKSFIEVLNENAEEIGLNMNDLGLKLKQKLNADWNISTAKTNAKILMNWAIHTKLAPKKYDCDKRGRSKSEKPASSVIKETLLNDVIPDIKKRFSYFSYKQINDLLLNKEITATRATLKSYIFEAIKNNVIFDAGKSWYSTIEKKFSLNNEPIAKIIETLKNKLPLLSFSCWSTEQLNSFVHHILSKHIAFVYVESDYIRSVSDVLKSVGYKVYENPNQAEIQKHFEISDRTVIVLPSITKQPDIGENAAPIEKILVDFLIENRRIKIIEEQEGIKVVKNAVNSGRINMASMISYSKRRKLRLLNEINHIQYIVKVEAVD